MGKFLKFILILLAVLVVSLLVAGGFAWTSLQNYLKGDAFRLFLSAQAGQALGVEGEFQPLTWQGSGLYSEGFTAKGRGSNALDIVELQQIRAHLRLRALWQGYWEIERVDIFNANVKLTPQNTVSATEPTPQTLTPPPPTGLLKWLAGFIPTNVKLKTVAFQHVTTTVPMGSDTTSLTVDNVIAEQENQGWALSSQGGKLRLPRLPVLQVVTHKSRVTPAQFSLTEAELRVDNQGKFLITGDVPFQGSEASALRVELTDVPVTPFLPEDWRARFVGGANGVFTVALNDGAPSAKGHLTLKNSRLEALPILRTISDFTKMPEFLSIRFQKSEADVEWKPSETKITNVLLESEKLLKVTGTAHSLGEAIDAQLRLGVDPATLKYLPGAKESVFTDESQNYLWAPVVVGGTWSNPKEDLSGRLGVAVLGNMGKALENAAETLKSKAFDAIDALHDFLKGPKKSEPTPSPIPDPL